uniref:ATP synthase subunit a n=1 Tax=Carukia barnesi TaxID=168717 RepID=G9IT21_CARBN|nr:ATP synthase F0 subunit 6 [Carukia barnesi]
MASYFDQFSVISLLSSWFTNVSVGFIIFFVCILMLKPSPKLVPNRIDVIWSAIATHWKEVVKDNVGKDGYVFIPSLMGLFSLLFIVNLLGFFPYVYTIAAQVVITFTLSFTIVLSITVLGIIKFRASFFSMWVPSGAPMILAPLLVVIETLSYFSRALSLGLRLAANLSAGHLLMVILGSFTFQLACAQVWSLTSVALFISLFVVVLEIAVAAIQAYVFCLLTAVYISDAYNLH